jgi:hypothetical protein
VVLHKYYQITKAMSTSLMPGTAGASTSASGGDLRGIQAEAELVVQSFSVHWKDKVCCPIKHQAGLTHANYMYSSLEDCAAKWATHLNQAAILNPKLFGKALINMFTPKSSHHTCQ